MAELLAVPSAVAGLMSLTITVIKLSRGYISSVKTSKKTIQAYFSELELLKAVLLEFNTLAENPETSTFLSGVKAFESDACRQELQSLHEKLLEMRRQQTKSIT